MQAEIAFAFSFDRAKENVLFLFLCAFFIVRFITFLKIIFTNE